MKVLKCKIVLEGKKIHQYGGFPTINLKLEVEMGRYDVCPYKEHPQACKFVAILRHFAGGFQLWKCI